MEDRALIGELMDDPKLPHSELHSALVGLARLNKVSFAANPIWTEIKRFTRDRNLKSIRVLDIACGGGDVLCDLVGHAKKDGIEIRGTGLDINPASVDLAKDAADRKGFNINFEARDVLQQTLPSEFDVIICSLFLHHLSKGDSIELLKKIAAACTGILVVSDLLRSKIGYLLAIVATRLLTSSKVVHVDGPRSVRAAWSLQEAHDLSTRAGLSGAQIRTIFPCRFLLTWEHGIR